MVVLHFLPTATIHSANERDTYLIRAEARSHAASVAYRNRSKRSNTLKRHKVSSSNESASRNVEVHVPSQIANNGPVDPFLKLAERLSRSDQEQLQLYLVSEVGVLYGGCCVIRANLFPAIAKSGICLYTVMLLLDQFYNWDAVTVAKRRRGLLKRAIGLIQDPASFADLNTAIDLAVLAMAEDRAGNALAARSHCAGLKAWFVNRGGFDCLHDFEVSWTAVFITVLSTVQFPLINSQAELESALGRLHLPRGECWKTMARYCRPSAERSDLAVLYLLNMISSHTDSMLFSYLSESAAIEPGVGYDTSMQYLVALAVRKTQDNTIDYRSMHEFVHLTARASHSIRARVANQLYANLTGSSPLEPVDIDELKKQIRCGRPPPLSSASVLSGCGPRCERFGGHFRFNRSIRQGRDEVSLT